MNRKTFNKIVKRRIREIETTLIKKGNEYANTDRLSSFKDSATLLHCTPEQALWGFVTKHIVALNGFVERLEIGGEVTPEQWIEKLSDLATYMLLLEAILIEEGRVINETT